MKIPYKTIRPANIWCGFNLRPLWEARELLIAFAIRDIKLRYRQTALGALWVLLQPLMGAIIFSFVFNRVAKLSSGGIPYLVFAFIGMMGWNAFNSTLTKASPCLVQHAGLLRKVYFPRLILPLSTVGSTLLDLAVSCGGLAVLMVKYQVMPAGSFLLLPVWVALLVALALGLSCFSSALMVSYRDFQHVMPVLTQLLMFASPVAYTIEAVPVPLRKYYYLNPLSTLLEGFRWSLVGSAPPPGGALIYAILVTLILLILGVFFFRGMERSFADVV
jgi:lipopolysaccharide transport system permease protein